MATPYIGEIRMFGGNFAPQGWARCNGAVLAIAQDDNDFLFNVIGTTYGGDGQTTFALPDLRGRIPIHSGNGIAFASFAGEEAVTLTVPQTPTHTHPLLGTSDTATSNSPQGNVPASLAAAGTASAYSSAAPFVSLSPTSMAPAGGSQPHTNMQPFLCVEFIISRFGIFPSPT
jgi:microcystin-dependent protein